MRTVRGFNVPDRADFVVKVRALKVGDEVQLLMNPISGPVWLDAAVVEDMSDPAEEPAGTRIWVGGYALTNWSGGPHNDGVHPAMLDLRVL